MRQRRSIQPEVEMLATQIQELTEQEAEGAEGGIIIVNNVNANPDPAPISFTGLAAQKVRREERM
jgi:hypothetical protein